jgi:hemoglobin-like flavoprotein
MAKARKKNWDQKVEIVRNSYNRAIRAKDFPMYFYEHLFFLHPELKVKFAQTDFEHQNKALMHGMDFLIGFLGKNDVNARKQLTRIAVSHSHNGLNIHPHSYYYWIEALIMTARKTDVLWTEGMEYYWREVINFPVSFIISQYFSSEIKSTV